MAFALSTTMLKEHSPLSALDAAEDQKGKRKVIHNPCSSWLLVFADAPLPPLPGLMRVGGGWEAGKLQTSYSFISCVLQTGWAP